MCGLPLISAIFYNENSRGGFGPAFAMRTDKELVGGSFLQGGSLTPRRGQGFTQGHAQCQPRVGTLSNTVSLWVSFEKEEAGSFIHFLI